MYLLSFFKGTLFKGSAYLRKYGSYLSKTNKSKSTSSSGSKYHGLRTPNEAFFHRIPKLFGIWTYRLDVLVADEPAVQL